MLAKVYTHRHIVDPEGGPGGFVTANVCRAKNLGPPHTDFVLEKPKTSF